MPDKYKATWVSHSSITDFLNCPRAYYLKNIYKNPETGRKITLMNPNLALGQVVHNILESLSNYPVEERFEHSLLEQLGQEWEKINGEKGGFENKDQEQAYKDRAKEMLKRVEKNPGPLSNLATKRNGELLNFWLCEEDEIMLCGMIDWFEFMEQEKKVHIIDFKTGKKQNQKDSLQLPIYFLLATECQRWDISKTSYWHLKEDDNPQEQGMPNYVTAKKEVLKVAKQIKSAREKENFECSQGSGCYHCKPLEKIISGDAKLVNVDHDFNKDIFITS